ncbi:MAG TPA: class I SAM-dependent methyltransferase [Polyangiales bacterium]
MTEHDWNAHYVSDELPWDTGEPDSLLVEAVQGGVAPRGRALEIGCGTGTNALWLAAHGFDVLATDIASRAIERAKARAVGVKPAPQCRFQVHDFLRDAPPTPGFQLVFDRGCFHVFSEPAEQAEFAARVAQVLALEGVWLSLIGSTEGPAREGGGPPRRSARELANAVEPALRLLTLRAIAFDGLPGGTHQAWLLVAQRRELPAQPSSRF